MGGRGSSSAGYAATVSSLVRQIRSAGRTPTSFPASIDAGVVFEAIDRAVGFTDAARAIMDSPSFRYSVSGGADPRLHAWYGGSSKGVSVPAGMTERQLNGALKFILNNWG